MRIGLIDVDGYKGFPNFALMKISAYHKKKKNQVEWVDKSKHYDLVYASKIFTFTPDYDFDGLDADVIEKGGTGYDISKKLPDEIENGLELDYSLYPDCDYSLVFLSRGCVRRCKFCLVNKKEGLIHSVKPVHLNPKGKWIDVLDNNFFASPDWMEHLDWLKEQKQPINFRGVDLRILTDEQMEALNKVKIQKSIFIAWDNPKDKLESLLANIVKHIKPYKLRCYVLVGFNSTIEEDLDRIYTLQKYNILPYVMPYKDFDNPQEKTPYQKDLCRWVNNVFVYKKCPRFNDYKPRKGFSCSEYLKGTKYETL